jgi:hypothetical protein
MAVRRYPPLGAWASIGFEGTRQFVGTRIVSPSITRTSLASIGAERARLAYRNATTRASRTVNRMSDRTGYRSRHGSRPPLPFRFHVVGVLGSPAHKSYSPMTFCACSFARTNDRRRPSSRVSTSFERNRARPSPSISARHTSNTADTLVSVGVSFERKA